MRHVLSSGFSQMRHVFRGCFSQMRHALDMLFSHLRKFILDKFILLIAYFIHEFA